MKSPGPNFNLLLIAAVLLFICSFFLVDQTFDIRIFETFYVINLRTMYWCGSLLLILCYVLYKMLPSIFYSTSLITTQIVSTVITILLIIGYHLWSGQNRLLGRPLNLYNVEVFHINNLALTILLFLLAFVQITLLINVVRGQLHMRKKRNQV